MKKFQISNFKYQISTNSHLLLEIGDWRPFREGSALVAKLKSFLLSENGFTLIEMLSVMVIFVVIGSILLTILVTSLRTSHKTDTLTLVRENGNYVLTQMAKTIRDSRGLISPFPCVPSVTVDTISVLTPDQDVVTFACTTPPNPTPATISSNSASLLDTGNVTMTDCSFTCTQRTSSDLPIIQINFSLKQQSTSTAAENTTTIIPFQTSIVMRNIVR